MRAAVLVFALLGVAATAVPAQDRLDALYDDAFLAWDRGDYVPALEGFARVLESPGGDRFLERIALLTGELYTTEEVVADGRAVRFGPDGRLAAYEAEEDGATVTHIVRIEPGFPEVARIRGTGVAFSPVGDRVAYVVPPEGNAVEKAQEALNREIQTRNREAVFRARDELRYVVARDSRLVVRQLSSGEETTLDDGGLLLAADLVWSADGTRLYATAAEDGAADRSDVYAFSPSRRPQAVTSGPGFKGAPALDRTGRYMIYTATSESPVPQHPGTTLARRASQDLGRVVVRDLRAGTERAFGGTAPAIAEGGSAAVFLAREGDETLIRVARLAGGDALTVARTTDRVAEAVISTDGRTVAYRAMPREDWEIFLVGADGRNMRRLTTDIQHDLYPRFLSPTRVLVVKGEGRHRRSYLYDAETGKETRLFHNNTIRTIAPEYEWAPSPDGTKLLIVSERDGDTVSPERGIYMVDLSRRITPAELRARIAANLTAERDLRERGRAMYAPIEAEVRRRVAEVSKTRLYGYQRDLYAFGSKYITQPGNRKAMEYLFETLASWGYEPEYQWFEPMPGVRTANVIARLPGTSHPELVYVVGSHFDSSRRGPGADDNTSGTSMLLETARVLKDNPLPATVVFAFFTGEEAGLLGSREFARRVGGSWNVAGALNNDMMGYANDHQLDNTIRYSNAGIRDVQHAAAFLFTDLITYDARYYKSTDAHALFDAFGDVIGGIGSYPVLANPHYHQSHDVLETIDHDLVRETTKTTVATVALLASSPARLKGLEIASRSGSSVRVTWEPAGESDVREYIVEWGPAEAPPQGSKTVTEPAATLGGVMAGTVVSVKAINGRGLASWDWARVVVPR